MLMEPERSPARAHSVDMSDTTHSAAPKSEGIRPAPSELPSTYQPKMKVGFNHGPRTFASVLETEAAAAREKQGDDADKQKEEKKKNSKSNKRIKHGDELLSSQHAEDQAHFRSTQIQQHHAHFNVLSGGQVMIPQKRWYRQRAHANPFSDHQLV